MPRNLTELEKSSLPDLPIVIPPYPGSHPFSTGSDPKIYKEEELKKRSEKKSHRTDWFEKYLFAIWRELEGEVPYAFKVGDQVRSLDAGCLGFLVNRTTPELALTKDRDGYITGATPIGDLASRYTMIEDSLRGEVRPPAGVTPTLRSPPAVASNRVMHSDSLLVAQPTTEVIDDVARLNADGSLSDTERRQLIDARIGQGAFRAKVLTIWDNRCALTGCDLAEVIRASHILPWRDASNTERLDPDNGLPLVATIDALFDKGLISFDNAGTVLFAAKLTSDHKKLIGSKNSLLRPMNDKMLFYLAKHRGKHGFPP